MGPLDAEGTQQFLGEVTTMLDQNGDGHAELTQMD